MARPWGARRDSTRTGGLSLCTCRRRSRARRLGVLVILNAVTSSRAVASLLTVRSEGDDPERLVFDRRREFAELAVPNRRCDAGSQWAAVVRSALADRGAAANDRLGAGDDVARVRGGDDREQGFWIRRASGYWFARDGIVLLVPQDDSFCFRTRPSARYRKGDISVTAAVGASLVLCHASTRRLDGGSSHRMGDQTHVRTRGVLAGDEQTDALGGLGLSAALPPSRNHPVQEAPDARGLATRLPAQRSTLPQCRLRRTTSRHCRSA